jgi:hypothetical protein
MAFFLNGQEKEKGNVQSEGDLQTPPEKAIVFPWRLKSRKRDMGLSRIALALSDKAASILYTSEDMSY